MIALNQIKMEMTINYSLFKNEIEKFIAKGDEVLKSTPKTEEELTEFIKEKKAWENECFKYLLESFNGDDKEHFANDFLESHSFNLGYDLPLNQKVKNSKEDLVQKIGNLHDQLKMIGTSDVFVNPELVKKENRDKFSVQQKKELLLRKLNELNDGRYYDVQYIFWSNGLKINNYDEPREIAKSLEQYDYLKTLGTIGGVNACITIEGVEYLESLEAEKHEQESNANKPDIEAINQKLDEVIEWLKRNDMGNEIIFDELQELKDAGEKLDLKNWKQLLKGKLFDLGADKAIGLGIEGAKEIFKIFTGEDITKFLK